MWYSLFNIFNPILHIFFVILLICDMIHFKYVYDNKEYLIKALYNKEQYPHLRCKYIIKDRLIIDSGYYIKRFLYELFYIVFSITIALAFLINRTPNYVPILAVIIVVGLLTCLVYIFRSILFQIQLNKYNDSVVIAHDDLILWYLRYNSVCVVHYVVLMAIYELLMFTPIL